MKRFLAIFLLHFQHIPQHRAQSFVWFIQLFINPLFMMLLWFGALKTSGGTTAHLTFEYITSYYFLLVFVSSVTMAHPEYGVAEQDINAGRLTKYLLKPFSYYWFKFNEEIHYRIIQGVFAIVILFLILTFTNLQIELASDALTWLLIVAMVINAFFISYTFKMILGLTAFWYTEVHGIFQLADMSSIVLGGYLMPIHLLPPWMYTIATFTPMPYIVYYPLIAAQGTIEHLDIIKIIGIQLVWLFVLGALYKTMWKKGINSFTAVGQ